MGVRKKEKKSWGSKRGVAERQREVADRRDRKRGGTDRAIFFSKKCLPASDQLHVLAQHLALLKLLSHPQPTQSERVICQSRASSSPPTRCPARLVPRAPLRTMASARPTPSLSSPATAIARWPTANAQTAMQLIVRRLGGVTTQRRAVQLRPFRLPATAGPTTGAGVSGAGGKKKDAGGRNLIVVRALMAQEHMTVFVEDPSAPLRRDGKRRETVTEGMEVEGDVGAEGKPPPHTRWSCCTVGGATQASPLATPFDAFLQRVLLGGGPANNSGSVGAWIPRSTAIAVEGFVVSCGGPGGAMGDWEVRVAQVSIKGGAAGGAVKGVLVEVSLFAL